MALDNAAIAAKVAFLTADLEALPGTRPQDLDEARASLALALAAGQPEPQAFPSIPVDLITTGAKFADGNARVQTVVKSALAYPPGAPQFLVNRRTFPVSAAPITSALPDFSNGRAVDRTLGPFRDSLGKPVWVDIFLITSQFRLVRSPGGAPFMTVPIQGLIASGDHFTLPAGSVWFISQQLAPGAPAGGYTGLKIKGGTLTFSQPLTSSGDEIVVPPAVTCTLVLQLDSGSAAAGSGPGQDGRLSKANTPQNVTLVFTATGISITAVGKGNLQAYGSSAEIDAQTTLPTYVAVAGRIFVPAKTNIVQFKIADVHSDVFLPSGNAPVTAAAWALPVAVVSPGSLGNASGAGGLALILGDGLSATWKGQGTQVPAGTTILLVDPGVLTVISTTSRGLGARQSIGLWSKQPGGPPSSQIDLSWPSQFELRFISSSSGAEGVILTGSMSANLDRPITVAGNRVYLQSKLAGIAFIESPAFNGVFVDAALDPPPSPPSPTRPLAFAIQNALLRTTPASTLALTGDFDGTRSKQGNVAIGFGLQFLLPSLPDPYAANVGIPVLRLIDVGTLGPLLVRTSWTPANPPVLGIDVPANATSLTTPAVSSAPQTATTTAAAVQPPAGIVLLDLSTNVDQFGVGFRTQQTDRTSAAPGSPLAVNALYLETASNSVSVLTLPAVQWEPVSTDSGPPFPSPLTFANSGGPTTMTVQSVQLVPVAPAPALDNLVANFTTSTTPQLTAGRWTLPFGILAFPTLRKPAPANPRGAALDYNRPKFPTESVQGGYQISITAIDPSVAGTASIEGQTLQLRNGLFGGLPANKSVLDDQVDTIFNGYLSGGGLRPQVPVTRIDLSGYGESLFSNWLNPTDDPVAVSQARFDVMIGRTSYEVIQVRSVLYPYAVRVVRTITIFRKNTGGVVRKDSGWQAVSDGEYLFPGIGLVTHPGVVQKIVNVTNIQDTGQLIDTGGVQVAGVRFDGDLQMQRAVKGAAPAGVPVRGQIGYVQLTPVASGSLTPTQYQDLISQAGPLGGAIDCVINIGGSGQLMKVGRVGVGVTQGMGGPEFVMTSWGSPQFPSGGQWSFLLQTGAGTAPGTVDQGLGVPLIRGGPAPTPPPLSSPYRFADPADLARPDTPASDYGIVHATGTQRVFFPRPKIEASAPDRITSTQAPVLADPYSLATALGYFPRTDSAIPFPNNNYALVISGGNYKLQLPSPSFPVTVGKRTLAEAGTNRSYADYSAASAEIAIDTSQAIPWSFRLKNAATAMSSGTLGEMMRVNGDIEADANTPAHLANSNVVMGGALGVVQDIMKFLQQLGFPTPMSVSMTNKVQLKVALKIPMDDELNKLLPPGGPHFEDTDVTVGFTVDSPVSEVEFELGATIFIPTPFDPLQAVGLFKFNAKISTESGNTFIFTIGAGVGVSFELSDAFKVTAYYVETEFLIIGDIVFGLGVGALLKGSIDLKIISVDVSLEAKMALLKVTCPPGETVWGAAQVTFAIEVTIAFIIDIDFEVQAEWDQNFSGGPCPLPDVL